jgi:hypothetical protein
LFVVTEITDFEHFSSQFFRATRRLTAKGNDEEEEEEEEEVLLELADQTINGSFY